MRYSTFFAVLFILIVNPNETPAQGPPFEHLEIKGKTNEKFNRVSLFSSGSDVSPHKTSYVTSGWYSLKIKIPQDMHDKGQYFITDMRFWGDKNNNGIKDPGEPISECHFIIWVPSTQIVYMSIYNVPKYHFKSSILEYNHN